MQNDVTKKPAGYIIPKQRSQNVGGSAQRVEPRAAPPIRTAAADAVPDAASPAYLQQVQERSAAARREREAQLKFPLVMRMRDVKLGTWACTKGDDVVEVTWSKLFVKFHPVERNPSTRTGALHEDLPLLKWRYENIAKIELDYQRRVIRLRGPGVFGDKVDEDIFTPSGSA